MAFAGPRFVLPPARVDLKAFRPDLVALAGCGGSGGGMPRIALDGYRGLWVRPEVVVPGRVLRAAPVGRDDGQALGCGIPYTVTVRGSPDLAPVVVRMTAGTPVTIPVKLRLPSVSLLTSWSRWFAVGRRGATPTFVAARVRIVRCNALASSKDRPAMCHSYRN